MRAGKPITPKERPASTNVVDLMEALRRSVGKEAAPANAARTGQEAAQGVERPEGDADVDRGQEAGEGSGGVKAVQAALKVCVILETPGDGTNGFAKRRIHAPGPPKAPPGENLPLGWRSECAT